MPTALIEDFVLALLATPLSDAAGFGTPEVDRWTGNLHRWLVRAAEQDPSLHVEELLVDSAGGRLQMVTGPPLPTIVDFVLVTADATDSATRPAPWAAGCDLQVVLRCRPDPVPHPAGVAPWCSAYPTFEVEPRWAAAVLLDLAEPLFWGVSAREDKQSALTPP